MYNCFVLLAILGIAFANPTNPEESDAFEGDMILRLDQFAAIQEQVSKQNAFAAIKTGLWKTNGKNDLIKYVINREVEGGRRAIEEAIADYHKYTCLRFQEVKTKPSGPHIEFYLGGGCLSWVGKQTYKTNRISLARGCWGKGTVIHEIGHSIGLYHEQSRPDRDNYVTIKYDNIQDKYKYAFQKYGTNRIDSRGTPYDLESIMHYGKRYFSKNGQITIETKRPEDQSKIGQRSGFSKTDIIQINKMYCENTPVPTPAPTAAPTCNDKNSNCPHWKSYCNNNDYVKKNCNFSCGRC